MKQDGVGHVLRVPRKPVILELLAEVMTAIDHCGPETCSVLFLRKLNII